MYLTIQGPAEGKITEKMSRFLAFAWPVADAAEAREVAARYQKEYHDARHVCWAYVTGADRAEQYSNDNGEPSGTAGKPILGQINSLKLTNVVVVVVRYFGGIKLGTPGLIAAYREAARALAKMPQVEIADREFDNTCRMTLRTRRDMMDALVAGLGKIDGVTMAE